MIDNVNHPKHYGGKDDPYEAIKVIEAWGLGFHLGNAVKYIARAGKKDSIVQDLKKAKWYLERVIELFENERTTTTETNEGRGTDKKLPFRSNICPTSGKV
jgi:hypothetical protein